MAGDRGRAWPVVLLLVAALGCESPRLDFAHLAPEDRAGDSGTTAAAGGATANRVDGGGEPAAMEASGGRAVDWSEAQHDPQGYAATGPEHTPSWCGQGQPRDERCGSDLDEDCDGVVDETPGLGEPCTTRCETPGRFVCDPATYVITCLDARGSAGCYVAETCGNGRIDPGEQCDLSTGIPQGWSEVDQLDPYCTDACHFDTYFVACMVLGEDGRPNEYVYITGGQLYNLCETSGLACSHYVRACVPTVGEYGLSRCPRLRRPESDAEFRERMAAGITDPPVYRMTEAENGECWITCSADSDCPALQMCYMGTCVVW